MAEETSDVTVLGRGLDQAAALLDTVGDDDLSRPTPCREWTVSDLVDHVVNATGGFATLVAGGEVDWSAPTPQVGPDRGAEFRSAATALQDAWASAPAETQPGPAWQCAELAVHTYDLASALGHPTADLDPEVAEVGLAFMSTNLEPEIRGDAFGPEQPAPDGADAYQRIAAFAGRTV